MSTGIISTFAGTGASSYSGDGGAATSAALYNPIGVALDSSDNLFIVDYNNMRIRKVYTVLTGAPSTTPSSEPTNTAVIPTIVPSSDIPSLTPSALPTPAPSTATPTVTPTYYPSLSPNSISIITTIAGSGATGSTSGSFSGDGSDATSATLYCPVRIALDSSGTHLHLTIYTIFRLTVVTPGNVYISDNSNNRIRKVAVSTGIITTFAGTGASSYSGDGGAATSAELAYPTGIALDNSGTRH